MDEPYASMTDKELEERFKDAPTIVLRKENIEKLGGETRGREFLIKACLLYESECASG